jgi:hypothetical protein
MATMRLTRIGFSLGPVFPDFLDSRFRGNDNHGMLCHYSSCPVL